MPQTSGTHSASRCSAKIWDGVEYIWGSVKKERACLMAQMVKNLPPMQETWVWFLGQEDLLQKGLATHSTILVWRISWTEEPAGYSPWGHKELDMPEWLALSRRKCAVRNHLALRSQTQKRDLDFPGHAVVKNPPCNAGDTSLIPGPGRFHMPRGN